MPFPSEHASRQAPPGQFKRFRRAKLKGVKGVSVIYGFKGDTGAGKGGSQIQSVRFDKKTWPAGKAKAWLKKHKMGAAFEAAKKGTEKK